MNEQNGLTEQDGELQLLAMIDDVLADKRSEAQEAGSLDDFCILLANTVPQANEAFKQHLEARLVAKLEPQSNDKASRINAIEISSRPKAHQTRTSAQSELRQPSRRAWIRLRPFITWVGAGVILVAILLGLFPGLRTTVAQAVEEIRRTLVGMSSAGPDAPVIFTPAPPFMVKQPDFLPRGFTRTAERYYPGSAPQTGSPDVTIIEEAVRLPTEPSKPQSVGPLARQAVEQDRGDEPHIVLVYEGGNGQYLQLFERTAQPDEILPIGETHTVSGQPAILQRSAQTLKLTWTDEGTWIELEGILPEIILLQVAESLVTTEALDVVDGLPSDNAPIGETNTFSELPFCDPDQRPPSWPSLELLLGEVSGQQTKGWVMIELADRTEGVSYSANVQNIGDVQEDVLEPALAALQEPDILMQQLTYPALSFVSSGPESCLRPNPMVQGYIIVEVWDRQVNLGYGGDGAMLKERAIEALEKELQLSP